MKKQKIQQRKEILKKSLNGKISPKVSLSFLVLATAIITTWSMISSCDSTSRPSTKSEINAQIEFQEKWNLAQKEAEKVWDSTFKTKSTSL